jgi:glycosyltransferase involved in cell wall biosynthesis
MQSAAYNELPNLPRNLHISLTAFRNESRVIKEARSIVNGGIAREVLVLALHEGGLPEFEQLAMGVELRRVKLKSRGLPKNFLFQGIKFLEFACRALYLCYVGRFGIVNVHTLPLLPLGALIKAIFGTKLVYDTHELETERNGLAGFRKAVFRRIESLFIRRADLVLVVGSAIADHYAKNYRIVRPTVVLNAPPYRPPNPTRLLREEFQLAADTTIFLYQGGLMSGRGIDVIIEAVNRFGDPLAVVVFLGYGPLEEEIKVAARESRNIYFHPAVPPGEVLDYTSSADVGISLIENTCLSYSLCMPNKLFEYVMAGLPVIASNMPEMANFVRENGVGVIARDENAASLGEAIQELVAMNLSKLKTNAAIAGRRFCWETQETVMLTAYKEMLVAAPR